MVAAAHGRPDNRWAVSSKKEVVWACQATGFLGGLLPAQEETRGSASANRMALASSFPLHTAKHCMDFVPGQDISHLTGDRMGQSLPFYTSLCLGPSVDGE